jgi:hypothetical protein
MSRKWRSTYDKSAVGIVTAVSLGALAGKNAGSQALTIRRTETKAQSSTPIDNSDRGLMTRHFTAPRRPEVSTPKVETVSLGGPVVGTLNVGSCTFR